MNLCFMNTASEIQLKWRSSLKCSVQDGVMCLHNLRRHCVIPTHVSSVMQSQQLILLRHSLRRERVRIKV